MAEKTSLNLVWALPSLTDDRVVGAITQSKIKRLAFAIWFTGKDPATDQKVFIVYMRTSEITLRAFHGGWLKVTKLDDGRHQLVITTAAARDTSQRITETVHFDHESGVTPVFAGFLEMLRDDDPEPGTSYSWGFTAADAGIVRATLCLPPKK